MTAVDMLKRDHKKVEHLFRQFEKAGERALKQKQRIAKQAFELLDLHTKLEEEIFYPAIRAVDQRGTDMVNEATEVHSIAKLLMFELQSMPPAAAGYGAKFKVLTENVRHHIHEEETEMLPHAAARLEPAALNELGDRMVVRTHAIASQFPAGLSGTLNRAKKLVAKAVDALTASTRAEAQSGHKKRSVAKRSPRRAASRRTAAQSSPRSPRPQAATTKSRGLRAVAKAKR